MKKPVEVRFVDRELLIFEREYCKEQVVRRKTLLEWIREPVNYRVIINKSLCSQS